MADVKGSKPGDDVFQVDLEPVGRRVDVPAGTDLLTAAQHAGVDLVAVCGGVGICGTCLVRLVSGDLTALSLTEKRVLLKDQIAQGYRLACQAVPLSDVRIDIPPGSLPVAQRLQLEGQEVEINIDPAVIPVDICVDVPNLDDLRSDFSRVRDALKASGHGTSLETDISQVAQLSDRLRDQDWKVRLAIHRDGAHEKLTAALFENADLLGLAVDIGTTKLAMYLVDLGTGATIAQAGAMNPQISYGEDVVSRIAFANMSSENGRLLQTRLVNTINQMIAEQCEKFGVSREQIVDAVMVGNTAMHHFFCGLPVRQLGASPYVPALSDPIGIR
ncbi:MAG: 2Fe-2S iron-sulfur cluster-binding protein, partial [Anaerolineaceae bacterium]|nr:2Fe-2S iron-sulfur cluster-binding protein [Anaerolineaceae bacterium]